MAGAGNYEAAVESCFKAHRLTDALLISNIMSRWVNAGRMAIQGIRC